MLGSVEDWYVLRFQGVLIGGTAVEGFSCAIRRIRAVKGSKYEPAGVIAMEELKQRELRNRNK